VRELVLGLSLALRERVLPLLGSHAERAHGAKGEGGDITFSIDAAAEETLEAHLAEHAPDVAFYSEDRGLVAPSGARTVLVVDPIDGTRPALAGLESCCVSVAAAPLASPSKGSEGPTMGEVTIGCVVEIPSGVVFLAERGHGLVEGPPVRLSPTESLDHMFWTYGFRGRPARATTEVLAELIDGSSVGGATFELGSAAFDMTRLLTGQLDAYVEPGPRIIAEVPGMREQFEIVGGGAVLNNSPTTSPPRPCASRRPARSSPTAEASRSPGARCSDPAPTSRCRSWPPPIPACTARSWRPWTTGSGG